MKGVVVAYGKGKVQRGRYISSCVVGVRGTPGGHDET